MLPQPNKDIFFWLLPASIALFITDINFYISAFMLKFKIDKMPFLALNTYYVPFFIFLHTTIIFLYKLLAPRFYKISSFIYEISILLVFNLIVATLYLSSVIHGTIVIDVGIYRAIAFISKLILFDLTIICLMCAKETWLIVFLLGIATLTSSDFLFNYASIAHAENIVVYGQIFWFLGQILIFFGLILFDKEIHCNLHLFFRKLNAVRSRIVFWTFSVATLGFLAFASVLYLFNLVSKMFFSAMPFFVMAYSLMIVMLASIVGRFFELPFNIISRNINLYIDGKGETVVKNKFHVFEFDFLQQFIIELLKVNNEENIFKNRFIKLASQVAHDIRSPTSAILMLTKENLGGAEETRGVLREAANRIQCIANDLIKQVEFDGNHKELNLIKTFIVSAAISSVVSEKKAQLESLGIKIALNIPQNAIFTFITADLVDFKRVISNLLNNSIEAIQKSGYISIDLLDNKEQIEVRISDSGKGISLEARDKIMQGYSFSNKSGGLGLGLAHARDFLLKSSGNLNIYSNESGGTVVNLSFKSNKKPSWIIENLKIFNNSTVIILDDDTSMHIAWHHLFASIKTHSININFIYFTEGNKCLRYITSLDQEERERSFLLTDYELLGQDITGLDIIELTKHNNAILVTGHYENNEILKRAQLLNVKILPKILAHSITVDIVDKTKPNQRDIEMVVLEDNKEIMDLIEYLCRLKGKKIDIYNDTYELLDSLDRYNIETVKFCLDFDLNTVINGIEFSNTLYLRGCKNIYLASGYNFKESEVPPFLKVLKSKMDLINL